MALGISGCMGGDASNLRHALKYLQAEALDVGSLLGACLERLLVSPAEMFLSAGNREGFPIPAW